MLDETDVGKPWDYLILTASHARQAEAYAAQIELRRQLDLLPSVRYALVVADPGGSRVGSGGSTIYCLLSVLNRELSDASAGSLRHASTWRDVLARLRILIIHAGGDSRRLPAYAPCGKIFLPVPSPHGDAALPTTLFDRQLPIYLQLRPSAPDAGQLVITSGDVLLTFDAAAVRFAPAGVTGLACGASPEDAARHGVYCADGGGRVRLYLQKPSPAEQAARQAVDRYGQSLLDIGVIHLDADAAVRLLGLCSPTLYQERLIWGREFDSTVRRHGLDFYREICCAMGTASIYDGYLDSARSSGSTLNERWLGRIYAAAAPIPFHVRRLSHCSFLHFGTTRQLISSGIDLVRRDQGLTRMQTGLHINNNITGTGALAGANAWTEGCRVSASVELEGENVLIGADVEQRLCLPSQGCLDVVLGSDRRGGQAWFVRFYGVDDSFKDSPGEPGEYCGMPLLRWLELTGATCADVWSPDLDPQLRSVWNAAIFPAESDPTRYTRWKWMLNPAAACDQERREWRAADRYSLEEIATRLDLSAFFQRRAEIRAEGIRNELPRFFRPESEFSAAELAWILRGAADRAGWVAEVLAEAQWQAGLRPEAGRESFAFARLIHTLATALAIVATHSAQTLGELAPGLSERLSEDLGAWLTGCGLFPDRETTVAAWRERARALAFEHLSSTIVQCTAESTAPPRSALRSDEIVWGRAPARLDIAGGWSDTPPYSLEHGGAVLNAAVDLNGQPPIQCYARITDRRAIRISSIDVGASLEIRDLDSLLDYRRPGSEFALAKAALALYGFAPGTSGWPWDATLGEMLEGFGGGIELTTLAAIPKGSGLGTSSIMGAVILAVVRRVMGRAPSRRELFYDVLRLEQALTTGGGWQDQIGGAVEGVKLISTEPGLVPDARIHFVPSDLLDPRVNNGVTLLYYTGITRLAKNILQEVVGRYLDRDRAALATLRQIHRLGSEAADAMAHKDLRLFGRLVDRSWKLNKQLDPNSSNQDIEDLLARVDAHVHGAKLLGAGGGGFLLLVCKSPKDADEVRRLFDASPPNRRARFFDFDINRQGLVVSVC